jgi:hypothetical protein
VTHIIDDPVHDPRWSELLGRHPSASVFHTPAWLEALRRTYGYQPVAVTTSHGAQIENGLVACRVRTWGSTRLVSLPFSDHCEPLASPTERQELVAGLVDVAHARRWGTVELRPRSGDIPGARTMSGGLHQGRTYFQHDLDLNPGLAQLFAQFHHSNVQRAIRRAEREGVTHEAGTSDEQLHAFFRLLRMTRRRHGLPPQPMAWFRNLRDAARQQLTIHVARHDGRPIGALLMLSFRHSLVYKYGGSDASRHSLGAMPFLFWHAIQAGKAAGATTLDLGRSDRDQPGLIAFKDHLGARQSLLTYYGAAVHSTSRPGRAWVNRTAGRLVSTLPDRALDLAGRLLYRHLG